jgi:hypothetical protein
VYSNSIPNRRVEMAIWNKETIVQLLKTNDRAVAKALVRLTERQTLDEREEKNSKYANGAGFRPAHARMGVAMAEFFELNGYLSPKQVGYWRVTDKNGNMRIGIYANQLLKLVG